MRNIVRLSSLISLFPHSPFPNLFGSLFEWNFHQSTTQNNVASF